METSENQQQFNNSDDKSELNQKCEEQEREKSQSGVKYIDDPTNSFVTRKKNSPVIQIEQDAHLDPDQRENNSTDNTSKQISNISQNIFENQYPLSTSKIMMTSKFENKILFQNIVKKQEIEHTYKNAYKHRQISIFSPIPIIYQHFGLGQALFHHWLQQLPILMLVSYMCIVVIQYIIFLINNNYIGNVYQLFDINQIAFDEDFIRSTSRGGMWFMILIIFQTFIKFMSLQRRILKVFNLKELKPKVQDYSIVLQNINTQVSDQEIKLFVQKLGGTRILNYVRIQKPFLLQHRLKLVKLQEEYIFRLQNDDYRLYFTNCCRTCSQKFGLLQLMQNLGFYRTKQFYEKAIDKQRDKLIKFTNKRQNLRDSVILTFSTIKQTNTVYNKLNQFCAHQLRSEQVKTIIAPQPDDIFYENLDLTRQQRFWKMVMSYFIMMLCVGLTFFVVTALRYFGNIYSQQQEFYLIEKIVSYSTLLISIIFDSISRPVLLAMQKYERHVSGSNFSKSHMVKFYFLLYFNRLTIYYSRTFIQMLDNQNTFFNIFDPSREWISTGGMDTLTFIITAMIMNNLIELLLYGCRYLFKVITAISDKDKKIAYKSVPFRPQQYSAHILIMITTVLNFAQQTPEYLIYTIAYLIVTNIIIRLIIFRISGLPEIQNDSFIEFFEKMAHFVCYQNIIYIGQCLWTETHEWFYLLIMLGILIFYQQMLYSKWFDKVIGKFNKRLTEALKADQDYIDMYKADKSKEILSRDEFDKNYKTIEDNNVIVNNGIIIMRLSKIQNEQSIKYQEYSQSFRKQNNSPTQEKLKEPLINTYNIQPAYV